MRYAHLNADPFGIGTSFRWAPPCRQERSFSFVGINKYLGFASNPTVQEITQLASEVRELREEAARMSASLAQLHQDQADISQALRDQIERMGTHLGDIVLAQLSATEALRNHVDMRLDLMSDTVLVTLTELVQQRGGPTEASSGGIAPIDVPHAEATVPADSYYDELTIPPADRQSMLVLSALFKDSVI